MGGGVEVGVYKKGMNEGANAGKEEERSEEEGAQLHFIAQSLTSCTDQYRSTKGDERVDRERVCVCVFRCIHSKVVYLFGGWRVPLCLRCACAGGKGGEEEVS